MAENKEAYKQRQMIVEHVFGTVKRTLGYTYFLTRRNENVRAESFMHFFIYNLKGVINIKGVKALIEYFKSAIFQCFIYRFKINFWGLKILRLYAICRPYRANFDFLSVIYIAICPFTYGILEV